MPSSDESATAETETAPEPEANDPRDPLADARDAALLRDQAVIDTLVAPVAAHFKEAVDAGQAVFVAVTVIVNPSHARTIPILPSVDDPDRRQLAIYLAAQQFGRTHVTYAKRTGQNLQLAARQPDE